MNRLLILVQLFFLSSLYGQIWTTITPGGSPGNPNSPPSRPKNEPAPFEKGGPSERDRRDEAAKSYGQYLQDTMPRPYEPPPYKPSKELQNLTKAKDYFKEQVRRRNEVREQVKDMDKYEIRVELVDYATESLRVSRNHYLKDEMEEGHIASQIADVFLDLATSLTPGVSWARDLYEAVVGKHLHTGEELDTFDRSMAVLGAVTVGFGSKIGKAFKVVGSLMKSERAGEAFRAGEKIYESAKKLKIAGHDLNRITNSANHIFGSKSLTKHNMNGFLLRHDGDMLSALKSIENKLQSLVDQGCLI